MIRILLGIVALFQIIIGSALIGGIDLFASINFDNQPEREWTNIDTASVSQGVSPTPATVSIGSISLNRHSH